MNGNGIYQKKVYADERFIISKHLRFLLNLPTQVRETPESLCKLADDTLQNLKSLPALGINVMKDILVQSLEEKLHKRTAEKQEETITSGSFPKLDQIVEFLYATAARLSKLNNESDASPSESKKIGTKSSQQLSQKLKKNFKNSHIYSKPYK